MQAEAALVRENMLLGPLSSEKKKGSNLFSDQGRYTHTSTSFCSVHEVYIYSGYSPLYIAHLPCTGRFVSRQGRLRWPRRRTLFRFLSPVRLPLTSRWRPWMVARSGLASTLPPPRAEKRSTGIDENLLLNKTRSMDLKEALRKSCRSVNMLS